jgi:hypothetical protein
MTQPTESDYKTAQAGDAKVRQEFIDAIDFEDKKEFVRRVTYDERGNFFKRNPSHYGSVIASLLKIDASSESPVLFDRFFTKKSNIYVFPKLFEYEFNLFHSIFVDHEGYHSVANAQRGGMVLRSSWFSFNCPQRTYMYFYNINEALARMSQIENSKKRSLSLDDLQMLQKGVNRCISTAKSSSDGRDILKDLERCFCDLPFDKLAREELPKRVLS